LTHSVYSLPCVRACVQFEQARSKRWSGVGTCGSAGMCCDSVLWRRVRSVWTQRQRMHLHVAVSPTHHTRRLGKPTNQLLQLSYTKCSVNQSPLNPREGERGERWLWNGLSPQNVRSASSLAVFRKRLKTHLGSRSFTQFTIALA